MRIAYIYPALTTIGGADRIIVDKANYFAEKLGYEVYIITAHQCGLPFFFPLSERVTHQDLQVNFNEQYRHSFLIRGFIYLKLLITYKKRLSSLLCRIKADFVITTISRDIDFIHSIKDGSIKIAEAHTPKENLRNLHLFEQKSLPYRITGRIWRRRMETAARKFGAFVVLTEKDAENWKNIRTCNVIPNSIPFYPETSSSCTNKQVISVGRLYPEKGYERLIQIWSIVSPKHPDWKLTIYGNGELKEMLSDMIIRHSLSDTLVISDPVSDIIDKYVESSIFTMTSRFEGFGMVLIEAMACGLPVISFDCPTGPSNIIKNNEDGILVKDGDIPGYAHNLCNLIEHEELRKEMGQKARINILRFSQDEVMKKWVDLFHSLKQF